jgi:hypothetical protein
MERLRELPVADAIQVKVADLPHLLNGEYGPWMVHALAGDAVSGRLSTLPDHVRYVVGLKPNEQVLRVDAGTDVAAVTNYVIGRNLPDAQLVRAAMGKFSWSATGWTPGSISVGKQRARPEPTPNLPVHAAPKPLTLRRDVPDRTQAPTGAVLIKVGIAQPETLEGSATFSE